MIEKKWGCGVGQAQPSERWIRRLLDGVGIWIKLAYRAGCTELCNASAGCSRLQQQRWCAQCVYAGRAVVGAGVALHLILELVRMVHVAGGCPNLQLRVREMQCGSPDVCSALVAAQWLIAACVPVLVVVLAAPALPEQLQWGASACTCDAVISQHLL